MKSVAEIAEEVFDAAAAVYSAEERAFVFSGSRGGESFEMFIDCLPQELDDEPLYESSTETSRRAITLRFKESSWTIPTLPRIGDRVTNAAGIVFAVTSVSRITRGIFKVAARQKDA